MKKKKTERTRPTLPSIKKEFQPLVPVSARPGDMTLAGDFQDQTSRKNNEYHTDQIVMEDVLRKDVGVGSELASVEIERAESGPWRNETLESTLSHHSDKEDKELDYPMESQRNLQLKLDAANLRKLDAHQDSKRARQQIQAYREAQDGNQLKSWSILRDPVDSGHGTARITSPSSVNSVKASQRLNNLSRFIDNMKDEKQKNDAISSATNILR